MCRALIQNCLTYVHPCALQGAPGNRGEPGPAGETGDEVSSLPVMPTCVVAGHAHPLTTPLLSLQGALGEDGPPGERVSESTSHPPPGQGPVPSGGGGGGLGLSLLRGGQ